MQELIRTQLWDLLQAQGRQGFVFAPVFLGVGVLIYFALGFEPLLWAGVLAVGVLSLGLWFVRQGGVSRGVVVFLLLLSLGFLAGQLRTALVHTPMLEKELKFAETTGRIAGIELLAEGEGMRLVLEDLVIEDLSPAETPRTVRVKLRKTQDLSLGQRVELLAGLSPPARPAYPGGFDFQRYMFFKGIGAIGFTYGAVKVVEEDEGASLGLFERVEAMRSAVATRIQQAMGAHGAGVATALMVGQKSALSEEDKIAMQESGLAHMLAISGLHIGLFSGVVFFFVRLVLVCIPRVALTWPVKKIAALCAISAAVFYMLLAGATIPTQRAVMMTGIVLLAIVMDRSAISMRLVAVAALVVLVIAPESLLSPSFQMSFGAVAALVAFFEWASPWMRAQYRQSGWVRRAGFYVLGVCLTTSIATLATAPFALFHFQKLALYGLLGNILAMPVLTFMVMPLLVLSYILMPFGLGGLAYPLIEKGVGLILSIAHFVSGLEFSVLTIPAMSAAALLFYAFGFVCLVLLVGWGRIFALPFMALGALLAMFTPYPFMLVASDMKLMAYRGEEALYVTSMRSDKFTRRLWESFYGLEENTAKLWPQEGATENLVCAEDGCRIEQGGHKVSVLNARQGLNEECAWADVVIVRGGYGLECGGEDMPRVIDIKSGQMGGPFALYEGRKLDVVDVRQLQGNRPWVAGRFNDKSASD